MLRRRIRGRSGRGAQCHSCHPTTSWCVPWCGTSRSLGYRRKLPYARRTTRDPSQRERDLELRSDSRDSVALFSSSPDRRDLTASASLLRQSDESCTHPSDPSAPAQPYPPREHQLSRVLPHPLDSLPRDGTSREPRKQGRRHGSLDSYPGWVYPVQERCVPAPLPLSGCHTDGCYALVGRTDHVFVSAPWPLREGMRPLCALCKVSQAYASSQVNPTPSHGL